MKKEKKRKTQKKDAQKLVSISVLLYKHNSYREFRREKHRVSALNEEKQHNNTHINSYNKNVTQK